MAYRSRTVGLLSWPLLWATRWVELWESFPEWLWATRSVWWARVSYSPEYLAESVMSLPSRWAHLSVFLLRPTLPARWV